MKKQYRSNRKLCRLKLVTQAAVLSMELQPKANSIVFQDNIKPRQKNLKEKATNTRMARQIQSPHLTKGKIANNFIHPRIKIVLHRNKATR